MTSPPNREFEIGKQGITLEEQGIKISEQGNVTSRYCQVDEKLADRPPRYWARVRREPAMLGIRNGCQPQLDSTLYGAFNYSQNSARDLRCALNGA